MTGRDGEGGGEPVSESEKGNEKISSKRRRSRTQGYGTDIAPMAGDCEGNKPVASQEKKTTRNNNPKDTKNDVDKDSKGKGRATSKKTRRDSKIQGAGSGSKEKKQNRKDKIGGDIPAAAEASGDDKLARRETEPATTAAHEEGHVNVVKEPTHSSSSKRRISPDLPPGPVAWEGEDRFGVILSSRHNSSSRWRWR